MGGRITTVSEFLGLTPEDEAFIETKLALSDFLREKRAKAKITQAEMAKRMNSTQSRVAKIEAGDRSVGFDLMFRAAFAIGATSKEIGKAISAAAAAR